MDDEIINSWCFNSVEFFDSTTSVAIIILDEDLESFSSLRSQQDVRVLKGVFDWRALEECIFYFLNIFIPIFIFLNH